MRGPKTETLLAPVVDGIAWAAARLPRHFNLQNLSLMSDWYHRNGYFKFKPGDSVECLGSNCGYAPQCAKLVVEGHNICKIFGRDEYVVIDLEGSRWTIPKWNLENQFKAVTPRR